MFAPKVSFGSFSLSLLLFHGFLNDMYAFYPILYVMFLPFILGLLILILFFSQLFPLIFLQDWCLASHLVFGNLSYSVRPLLPKVLLPLLLMFVSSKFVYSLEWYYHIIPIMIVFVMCLPTLPRVLSNTFHGV